MISYEIQLRYAIQDKIQSKKKFEKMIFCQKKYFVRKKIVRKRIVSDVSQISSTQSELSRTNRCLSSLSGMPQ